MHYFFAQHHNADAPRYSFLKGQSKYVCEYKYDNEYENDNKNYFLFSAVWIEPNSRLDKEKLQFGAFQI